MGKIDKLNRKNFIKFIENLITNSHEYKRDNDSLSYVMALDSPWGTGKSYFIDLLLEDIEKHPNIFAIKYNAWENDYCDNAFNPIIYDILQSNCLNLDVRSKAKKENIKNLLKSTINVGAVFGKQLLTDVAKNKFGIDIENALDTALNSKTTLKEFMFNKIPNLAELNAQRDSFEKLKEYLNKTTEWLEKEKRKLVIIIDELDRCKPTFAIQTLEVVKHIFDIKNVVFLFAVDIHQLSYSISSIYGQGFDSVGYLCRFFDYIAKMPAPEVRQYIKDRISHISSMPQIEVSALEDKFGKINLVDLIADFFHNICHGFDFTLRDLDTILQSYQMMVNNFLKDYEMAGAHMIYIFYLALKYKKPQMFSQTFIDTANYQSYVQNELTKFVRDICNNNKWVIDTIAVLQSGTTLNELTYYPQCDGKGNHQTTIRVKINSVSDTKIHTYYPRSNGYGQESYNPALTSYESMGNILFEPDLKNWEKIKTMTYREYLHKQLEMYNFINPEDNTSEQY